MPPLPLLTNHSWLELEVALVGWDDSTSDSNLGKTGVGGIDIGLFDGC